MQRNDIVLGAEAELFATLLGGKPADVDGRLSGESLLIPGVGMLDTDAGINMPEIAFAPSNDPREIKSRTKKMFEFLYDWWPQATFQAIPVNPCGIVSWARKPRYGPLREAVIAEVGHAGFDQVTAFAAAQIHVSGFDPLSDFGMQVRDELENWGPYIARYISWKYGKPSHRLKEMLRQGIACDSRLPAPRVFGTWAGYQSFISKVPRLTKRIGDEWVVDGQTPTNASDSDAMKEIWHYVRISPKRDDKPATVEFRPCDSVGADGIAALAAIIQGAVLEIFQNGKLPLQFSKDEWQKIRNDHGYWLSMHKRLKELNLLNLVDVV